MKFNMQFNNQFCWSDQKAYMVLSISILTGSHCLLFEYSSHRYGN